MFWAAATVGAEAIELSCHSFRLRLLGTSDTLRSHRDRNLIGSRKIIDSSGTAEDVATG